MGVDDSVGRKDHRSVEVPASDYQPTKAEKEEPVKLEGAQDMTVEQAVQRILRPVEVREVPAAEYRARRKDKGK